MAKSRITFSDRFPFAGLFLVIAIVVALPITVFSLKYAPTNVNQEAAGKNAGGYSSMAIKMVTDNNSNDLPNYNDTITFDVSTNQTDYPYVSVVCFKDSVLVYSAAAGFYPSYPWPGSRNMSLFSQKWTGGAADCKATLNDESAGSKKTKSLSTLSFHVDQ